MATVGQRRPTVHKVNGCFARGALLETIEEARTRFLSFVIKTDNCWLWVGGVGAKGRPFFTWNGKRDYAYRHAVRLFKKKEPGKLNVCHHCDTPMCVRPRHLFLGTQKKNLQDAACKGRCWAPTKLSDREIRLIRGLITEAVLSLRSIGRQFAVSHEIIRKIRDKKLHKGVK